MKLRWLIPLLFVLPAFAAGGACPTGANYINPTNLTGPLVTLSSLGVTTCFYISKSTGGASDSNNGQSHSTPWLHVPGMTGCSGTCGATTPTGGEGFIFEGGDTWSGTDIGPAWSYSGSNGSPLYAGVDLTWFNSGVCGGSWCRPIFAGGGGCSLSGAGSSIWTANNQQYDIFDNFEVTGMSNGFNGLYDGGDHDFFVRNYIHAWGYCRGAGDNVGVFAVTGAHSIVAFNDTNGSDSLLPSGDCSGSPAQCGILNGCYSSCGGTIAYNHFSYLVSGLLAGVNDFHGNIVENGVQSAENDHCNLIFDFGPATGTVTYIYNNIARNQLCAGGTSFWLFGNAGPPNGAGCPSCVTYAYNNLVDSTQGIIIGGHPPPVGVHSTGTYYILNNTINVPVGAGNCMGNGETYTSQVATANVYNSHCIGPGAIFNTGSDVTINDLGGNLLQTLGVANGQGYTSAEAMEFSPISSCTHSTCSTVQNGSNLNSPIGCSASTTALCSSIQYPVYNSTTHTMGFNAANGRPSSGAWDTGVYQFASATQATQPSCSPGSGNYTSTQTVTCTNPNSGTTVMCYTTNGSTPDTNDLGTGCDVGTQYMTTISVASAETLNIVAGTSTLTDSTGVSYVYTFNLATPTFTPGAGAYSSTQNVTIGCLAGATACYTTDGTTPTASTPGTCSQGISLSCGGTVLVASSETLNALATTSGSTNSSVATAVYTIGIVHVGAQGANTTSGSNSFTFTYTPTSSTNDGLVVGAICHPSSGTVTSATLTASGWGNIYQSNANIATSLGGVGFQWGLITPNTSLTTFTVTFAGVTNCSSFSGYLLDEYQGINSTGGSTTFNATGSSGASTGGCNQTAANVTPPLNAEAITIECFDSSSVPITPFLQGAADTAGNVSEWLVNAAGAGVAITPAYITTSGFYIVMGTAIAASGQPNPTAPSAFMAQVH